MTPATTAVNCHTPNISLLLAESALAYDLTRRGQYNDMQGRQHTLGTQPHFFDYDAQRLELLLNNGFKNQ